MATIFIKEKGTGRLRPVVNCTMLTWKRSQFKNIYFTEMCSGSEAGLYLRLIDFCITQL